jgi:hypothetical protein
MAQESDDARSRMNRLDMLSSTTNSDPSMALAMGGSIYQNNIITPAFLMKKKNVKKWRFSIRWKRNCANN